MRLPKPFLSRTPDPEGVVLGSSLHTPPSPCQYASGRCDQEFENATAAGGIFLYASHSILLGLILLGLVRADTARLVYAVIFVSGIARSYLQPTRAALPADLVPRELYANSITWRSVTSQSAGGEDLPPFARPL